MPPVKGSSKLNLVTSFISGFTLTALSGVTWLPYPALPLPLYPELLWQLPMGRPWPPYPALPWPRYPALPWLFRQALRPWLLCPRDTICCTWWVFEQDSFAMFLTLFFFFFFFFFFFAHEVQYIFSVGLCKYCVLPHSEPLWTDKFVFTLMSSVEQTLLVGATVWQLVSWSSTVASTEPCKMLICSSVELSHPTVPSDDTLCSILSALIGVFVLFLFLVVAFFDCGGFESCSFGLLRVPFVNCRQFMYLVISLLVLRVGCGIWLYQFLNIAYHFILSYFQHSTWMPWFSQNVRAVPTRCRIYAGWWLWLIWSG